MNLNLSKIARKKAQLGEHCSANAEATGSNPVEAPKNFFSGYFRNCLNCDSLRWSHTHFICIPAVHIISFKGRYIGENIRLIIDIMEHTKSESIPGILVSLDFQKAFDSLEWSFMMKALDIFNFGTSIKRWIRTFYTNIESAAINNDSMTMKV